MLRWFIGSHCPQLVIATSRLAGRYAERNRSRMRMPFVSTPHPGSRWWNAPSRSYGNLRGRDLFSRFLTDEPWTSATG